MLLKVNFLFSYKNKMLLRRSQRSSYGSMEVINYQLELSQLIICNHQVIQQDDSCIIEVKYVDTE